MPPGTFDRTLLAGQSIDGRISVRYRNLDDGKEEALSGRFAWTASGDDLELSLLDPLGQTVALIRSGARRSTITFRDGRRVEGDSPEALTQQTLGWTVPLGGLRSWLEGRPSPASPAATLDDGRIRQDHWTLRFTPPDDAPAGAPPRRIDLTYPGPPAEIEMRLVIDQRGAG